MSFFDEFKRGYQQKKDTREFQELANHLEDISPNYREKAFNTSDSNRGWYACAHCGKMFRKRDMDADHIIPQKHGGTNHRENLQLLCVHCNRSKRDSMDDTEKDLRRREREIRQIDKEFQKVYNKKRR